MFIRPLAIAVAAIAALLVVTPAGLGGGWALTTLDPVSAPPRAGEPTAVGYTIRQHGTTPADLPDTAIAITDASGATTAFAGRRAGPVGHYVADVTFPSAGRWTWTARMGWFGEQPLGGIDIVPAADADSGAGGRDDSAGWLLLAGALACAALLAGRVAGRRGAPAPT